MACLARRKQSILALTIARDDKFGFLDVRPSDRRRQCEVQFGTLSPEQFKWLVAAGGFKKARRA